MLIERHLDVTQTVRSQDEHGVALVINQVRACPIAGNSI